MTTLEPTWIPKVTSLVPASTAEVARLEFTGEGGPRLGPTVAVNWMQLGTPEAGKMPPVNQGLGNMQNPH